MKRKVAAFALSAAALMAQSDGGSKVTVPLHDPSRPAQIRAHLISGGITVTGYDGREVVISSRHKSSEDSGRGRDENSHGMHRLEFPENAGLDVVEEDNVVTIKTDARDAGSDLFIRVPRRSSLQLKCLNNGDIEVSNIDGEIDADDLNGKVTLKNVSGSVVAHSLNGRVFATMDRVDAGKPMSFSTMNGDIDVTLPRDIKANFRMKTDNGEIFSDFDVKLDRSKAPRAKESGRQEDGKYRIHLDRTLRGLVNGGGPEYQFTSFNGQIYLREKK